MIGNYGIPKVQNDQYQLNQFFESNRIWCNGIIVQDYSHVHSHWNAEKSLSQWMKEYDVPGLYDIDTRSLTKILRENGSILGKIVVDNDIALTSTTKFSS